MASSESVLITVENMVPSSTQVGLSPLLAITTSELSFECLFGAVVNKFNRPCRLYHCYFISLTSHLMSPTKKIISSHMKKDTKVGQ